MAIRSLDHPDNSPKPEKQDKPQLPLNFLLGCSQQDLDSFQLARLAAVANLRSQLQEKIDKLIDELMQAGLAAWFRKNDRETLKTALETEESALEWAKRMIRGGGEIIPRICLEPGKSHRIAALTYQARNIAEGKCATCPQPLDPNSVRYCTEHLAKERARGQQKKGLSLPGTREYLYSGEVTPTRGRQPSQLAKQAMHREQKTRALLAELGIPPENAAVSLNAAKEALLECMPAPKDEPMTAAELFDKACVSSLATGKVALKQLFSVGRIERTGKGISSDPFRYSLAGPAEHRKPNTKSRVRLNQALQAILKGEAE